MTIKKSSDPSLAYRVAGWLAYYAFIFWASYRTLDVCRSMFGWPERSSFGEFLVFIPASVVAALIGCVFGTILNFHRRQILAAKLIRARKLRQRGKVPRGLIDL